MYDNEIKDKFVELRAEGKSFGDISEQLGIAKSTLHRWEDEREADIARLRRIQWEEFEAQAGCRLEDRLTDVGCSIKDYEMRLGDFNLNQLSLRDTVMLLRESRREYYRLRAMLMGTSPVSRKSNKTERFEQNAETNTRNTNNLQRPLVESFDSVTPEVTRGLTSSQPAADPTPFSADAVHDSTTANHSPETLSLSASPSISGENPSSESNKTERSQENVTPELHNHNHLQQAKPESFDFPEQSKIENPKSKIEPDDFLGSIVINPQECAAGVVIKCLEAEAAHSAARNVALADTHKEKSGAGAFTKS